MSDDFVMIAGGVVVGVLFGVYLLWLEKILRDRRKRGEWEPWMIWEDPPRPKSKERQR
jgi:hypothetical protein